LIGVVLGFESDRNPAQTLNQTGLYFSIGFVKKTEIMDFLLEKGNRWGRWNGFAGRSGSVAQEFYQPVIGWNFSDGRIDFQRRLHFFSGVRKVIARIE